MPGSFFYRHWKALFIVIVAVLVVATGIKAALKVTKPGRTGEVSRTAFLRWRPQIEALHRGEDIYRSPVHPNPPIMALILSPFLALSPLAATLTWFSLKVGMAVMMCVWCRRLFQMRNAECGMRNQNRVLHQSLPPATLHSAFRIPNSAFFLAIALSLHPMLSDLSHGNVNMFIAFLVFAGLECYRRQRDLGAGLLFALAIACKVTPALFVPYFLWKRAWRTLFGIFVGMVLWWGLLPGLFLGYEHHTNLMECWFDTMVKPFVIDGEVTSVHPNQSLPGLLTRLFTAKESFTDYAEDDGRVVPTESHTLVNLGPTAVSVMVKLAMLVFVIVMALRIDTRRNAPRQGLMFAAEVSAVLLGMLLFSERTWKHHAVTLILPLSVLCVFVSRTRKRRDTVNACDPSLARPAIKNRLMLILILVPVLSLLPSMMPERTQDLMLVYGSYTIMYALLMIGVLNVLKHESPTDAGRDCLRLRVGLTRLTFQPVPPLAALAGTPCRSVPGV